MAASIRMRPSIVKKLYFQRTSCIVCRECQTAASTTSVAEGGAPTHIDRPQVPRGQINIPKKKKRDSLSILKALASTVGTDPTAPGFVYLDDPGLAPRRNERNLVLLSKASGKRTARFMVNEYKNTFDHNAAAPHVKAFQPDLKEYMYKDVCTDALRERIALQEVSDAIEVYNRLLEEGHEVNADLKLSFLELLCVFGCKDRPTHLMPEEKIVENLQRDDDPQSFKLPMEFAEEVFNSLPEKTDDAYNWLARGLAKVKLARGLYYYREMKEKGIPVYLGTYNELISFVSQQKVDRMEEVKNYLTLMKKEGVAPNLETFHSVLRALKYTKDNNYADSVPSVLAEMKVLNIEPTLQTFSLVLSALRPVKPDKPLPFKQGLNVISDIHEIIKYMRARGLYKYRMDHPKEHFLFEALSECRDYRDLGVAEMLYDVKEEMGCNYITTSLSEEDNFFGILLRMYSFTEHSDKMMEFYNKKNSYYQMISFPLLKMILDNIETYTAYHHLPQLWEDHSDFVKSKEDLLDRFLEMFGNDSSNKELRKIFVNIAKGLFEQSKVTTRKQIEFEKIGNGLIRIFINNGELDLAWEAAMFNYQNGTQGSIKGEYLTNVLEMSILQKDVPKIMSFCKLPSEARDSMAAAQVLYEKRNILEECLNDTEMKEFEEAFGV